jgi:autotransporter-associated beta strand protein
LPGANDTVVLERSAANITVSLAAGAHTIRKLFVREGLNITGGSLVVGYVPSSDSTPMAAQFSAPVTVTGTATLSVHTLQVDAAQTFTIGHGGTLTFNTINLMPHATTPAKIALTGDPFLAGATGATGTINNGAGTGTSGFIDLGGATRVVNVANGAAAIDLALNVPVTNGGLTKTGAGTLALGGVNTYTGSTVVQAGRLELNGVLNGNVAIMNGATFALGAASTGVRTINGSFTLEAGGTFRARLNGTLAGTEHDQLSLVSAASTMTLGGTLDLVAAPNLPVGATFRIIQNSGAAPVSGMFAGLPQGTEFYEDAQWWRIDYAGGSGNDVVLTRIAPKPWQLWLLANFATAVNDPAVAGDFADVEGDGVVNRLEYAFGGNPKVATTTTAPLVRASIIGGRLAITFDRVTANNDITIIVQGADNPNGPWTDLASSVNAGATTPLVSGVLVTETGTGPTRTVQVADPYLVGDSAHSTRFLRLQVTRP